MVDRVQHIVVWDPEGEFWEGGLVDASRARQLEARGVILLPIVPRLFAAGGIGGFHKRAWGAGWPLPPHVPAVHCPLTIHGSKQLRALHWAARLVPENVVGEHSYDGQLRFMSDLTQANVQHASYLPEGAAFELSKLGPLDPRGGWIVRGRGSLSPTTDGFMGFAFYGFGPGLKMAWAACSQSEV